MSETLEVKVERGEEGTWVLSPAVGIWRDPPRAGRPLGGGSPLGTLLRLNRCFTLIMPAAEQGIVGEGLHADRIVAVEYGQRLFRLLGLHAELPGSADVAAGQPGPDAAERLPEGTVALRAPTDGVFYRGPSPDAPPFIEAGSALVEGQPIGLVEVMKTFHQLTYGGEGMPEKGQVVEVRVADGAEVRIGQILVVVR